MKRHISFDISTDFYLKPHPNLREGEQLPACNNASTKLNDVESTSKSTTYDGCFAVGQPAVWQYDK